MLKISNIANLMYQYISNFTLLIVIIDFRSIHQSLVCRESKKRRSVDHRS